MPRRRECVRCHRKRNEKFFVSARGRVCTTCKKRRTAGASKDQRLRDAYGITLAEWEAVFDAQGRCCAVCAGTRPTYDVDHDHKTEGGGMRQSVRGILCRRCNRRLLPASLDRPDILLRAVEYLETPPAQKVLT